MVPPGVIVGLNMAGLLTPVVGDHEKEVAPLAVIWVDCPWQMLVSPEIDMAGPPVTVTVTYAGAVQPEISPTVQVYVVVTVG